MNWPWSALGLDGPSELSAIRRAYAARLKTTHPEEDPEGFERLHAAYQTACRIVRHSGAAAVETQIPPPPPPSSAPPQAAPPEAAPDPVFVSAGAPEAVREADGEPEAPPETGGGPDRTAPPQYDFNRLFAEAEAARRKAHIAAWRVRVQRATDLMARSALPFERRKDAKNTARVVALQALYLLEEPDPPGGWDLNCKVLLGHESFQTVMDDPLFIRCLVRFFREHPDLPQAVRNAFFREYGFPGRKYIPLKYRRLWNALASEQVRSQRRMTRLGNFLCGLFIVVFLASVMGYLAYHPPFQLQGARWLEEDFGMEVYSGDSVFRPSRAAVFSVRYGSDGTWAGFFARRDGERDLEAGERGYRTNLTNALFALELTRYAEAAGWTATAADPLREDALERPAEVWLHLPLTGAGKGLSGLGAFLSALPERDWYQKLPPAYLLNLCWQDWCFYPYTSSDGAFDAEGVRDYYEAKLGPALCTVLVKETGTADGDLGAGTYSLSEAGTMEADGAAYFASIAVGNASGEPLALYLLSEDGRELFVLPPDMTALSRETLYAKEPEHRDVNGLADGLDIRDYLWEHTTAR